MVTVYNIPLSTTSEKALFGRPGGGREKSIIFVADYIINCNEEL